MPLVYSGLHDRSAYHLKMLMHFLQIITLLDHVKLETPSAFRAAKYIDDNVGGPVKSELLSFDCSLANMTSADGTPVNYLFRNLNIVF